MVLYLIYHFLQYDVEYDISRTHLIIFNLLIDFNNSQDMVAILKKTIRGYKFLEG